jgi:hypothetical protein
MVAERCAARRPGTGSGLQASSSAPHFGSTSGGAGVPAMSTQNALAGSTGFSALLDVRRPRDGPGIDTVGAGLDHQPRPPGCRRPRSCSAAGSCPGRCGRPCGTGSWPSTRWWAAHPDPAHAGHRRADRRPVHVPVSVAAGHAGPLPRARRDRWGAGLRWGEGSIITPGSGARRNMVAGRFADRGRARYTWWGRWVITREMRRGVPGGGRPDGDER